MLVAKLASTLFSDDDVMLILDQIKFGDIGGESDDEEEDLYNSEGDGYSH